MKTFLIALIFIFNLQSITQANDISSFEIGGFSLNESLLKFFDKEKIKKELNTKYTYYYKDKKFAVLGVGEGSNYNLSTKIENYDELAITIKPNDKNYKIYSVSGDIFCLDDIENCLSKQREIIGELESFLDSNLKFDAWEKQHSVDPSGKSMVYGNNIEFSDGSDISVDVYSWSKEMKEKNNFPNTLQVSITTKEFANFLRYEAYK